ncbi:MAG: hypothetical protein M3O34_01725, partial [Chloroflexota bacterium]|nr:hypothetical protein [Chloroflexota bacterium]
MKLGLLWFDANPKVTPRQRLAEAAARYAERFGRPANCCHVHPDEMFTPDGQPAGTPLAEGQPADGQGAAGEVADGQIVIVADPAILRHHIWVGFDEAFAPEPARKRRRRRTATRVAEPSMATAPTDDQPSVPRPEAPPLATRAPNASDAAHQEPRSSSTPSQTADASAPP